MSEDTFFPVICRDYMNTEHSPSDLDLCLITSDKYEKLDRSGRLKTPGP